MRLCRVVAVIEFVLYIYIQSLRMKLSMKNKFPNRIPLSEMSTYFEITASQALFIVQSVLNLFIFGAVHEYRTRKTVKRVIENLHISIFQLLNNQIPCYYSFLFRIILSLHSQRLYVYI